MKTDRVLDKEITPHWFLINGQWQHCITVQRGDGSTFNYLNGVLQSKSTKTVPTRNLTNEEVSFIYNSGDNIMNTCNINKVVKDVKYLIATNSNIETIAKRIENFIDTIDNHVEETPKCSVCAGDMIVMPPNNPYNGEYYKCILCSSKKGF